MAQVEQGGAGWMVQIYAVNLGAAVILGTALHLYLYTFSGQEMRLKFDLHPIEKSARSHDGQSVGINFVRVDALGEIKWSVARGVPARATDNAYPRSLTLKGNVNVGDI